MVVRTPHGVVKPLVLAAAGIAGIDTIYRIGGAQAVGALAYGTETISPVDKIVGPGNAYVAAAKRQVYGTVGIDMIAGPSEILVLADGENDPAWIAADLLSQAEHDLAAQAILMTDDRAFADSVVAAVDGHLKTLPRADTAGESWRNYGAVIIVPEIADALPLIDRIAPEHLEIATEDARALAMQVRNAGAIFMGRFVPEALGDYLAGPNHVLPTARSARFSSGLGVLDFMKRTSMVGCGSEGLSAIGPAGVALDARRRIGRARALGFDTAQQAGAILGQGALMSDDNRILSINLDEKSVVRRSAQVEHERKVAIFDLLEDNEFALCNGESGPYKLNLGIEENRLVFNLRGEDDARIDKLTLPISVFRSIVKDYFMICDKIGRASCRERV